MGFYAELRQETDHIFEAIFEHPFVVELTTGTLPEKNWAYYLGQDYQYLRDFKQVLGLALIQLETPREIFEWMNRIAVLADMEARRHLNWATQLGLTEEQLLAAEPDPMALVYRQHMMLAGYRGIGELLAAQVPCPVTYMEIADRAADRVPDHPIYGDWVRSYSSRLIRSWRPDEAGGARRSTSWPRMRAPRSEPGCGPISSARAGTSGCSGTWPTRWRAGP